MKRRGFQNKGDESDDKRLQTLAAAHARLEEADKLRKAGNLQKALTICEALIDKFPDYVGALHTLGLIHMEQQTYWPALSCFVKAAMLNPGDWTILTNLAQVYLGLGAAEMSAQTLEQALTLKDDEADVHCTLGQIYDHEREYELAAKCFERSLECDPRHLVARYELGSSYDHMGRIEDATAAFLRAHQLEPTSIAPLAALGQLPGKFADLDILAAIETARKNLNEEGENSQIRFSFTKAAAFDKLGRHAEAWDHLVQANSPLFTRHQEAYQRHARRREIWLQQARRFRRKSGIRGMRRDDTPISLFILGPSRSGKTLLEMLAGTLDGVKRGYENPIVEKSVRKTAQFSGLLTLYRPTQLPDSLDQRYAAIYNEMLLSRAGNAKVFTSTEPGRIPDVGRLYNTIPNSLFAFVIRNPQDSAFRIFMKHYREDGNFYAYKIQTIFEEISWYNQMIEVWMKKLPAQCTAVRYEDMVTDPRAALCSVAELCGLTLPSGDVPDLVDDRGCAAPYAEFIENERLKGGA